MRDRVRRGVRSRVLAGLAAAGLALAVTSPAAAFEPEDVEAAVAIARDVRADVEWLADDARAGRYPGSQGWLDTQDYLIDQLEPIAQGLVDAPGSAAFLQHFLGSHEAFDPDELVLANVVAMIPGGDLADEYVIVGGHYDHLMPERCRERDGDDLCNGAMDNAAGTAAVLAIARAIAALPAPPRRSIVFALWDAEEYGLVGSQHFVVSDPLVPLEDVAAYVNLDLLGSNLAPSARHMSFAVGAETGGALLQQMARDAIAEVDLDVRLLSQIFGQERSDYVWFREPGSVPFIYFSDSTNACYHTGNDEIELVDFGKLADEAEVAFRVVLALAEADERPSFVPPPPLTDAYEDLVVMADVLASVLPDLDLLDEPYRQQLVNLEAQARQGVEAGPENYANLTAGVIALQAIQIAENGFACDPTLLPEPSAASFAALGALVALARARRRREPDGNGSTG
jgi:hypothetical protein